MIGNMWQLKQCDVIGGDTLLLHVNEEIKCLGYKNTTTGDK